ncbi:hypothetical protein R3W88_029950 [Solanum pinnatisectum]|uniref:Ubiquitin-like domain-containing protein n=1 Tax=Solanum pinnatisectum TaxID=50273 RepID=A0AAV9K935_9SOLN|nr:hypothetical protein R3W88_029950 [Solanum pinnatisectum]
MVNPNDTVGAIKPYIAFKKQRILSQDGEDLSDDVQKHTDSLLILRYAPVIAELSVRMFLMSFIVKDPWLLISRTMEIVIHDDTYKDMIEFRSVSKSKLPVFKSFEDEVLRDDAQTLSSLGIRDGCALILRYGLVYKVSFIHKCTCCVFKMRIKPGDTLRDVKARIKKKG